MKSVVSEPAMHKGFNPIIIVEPLTSQSFFEGTKDMKVAG
jgi:hypothetical protein